MNPVSSASIVPAIDDGATLLAALLAFPAPLILASLDGRAVLSNEALHREFGPVRLGQEAITALLRVGSGPMPFRLETVQGRRDIEVTTLCASLAGWNVVLVGHALGESPRAELQRLRHAVSSLERAASTDHLTGAWNRAHFDRVIASEVALAHPSRRPLSLVLVDIDHFKRINDGHGHAMGDAVLQQLVRTLQTRVRATDDVFRWGGEEFAILLRDAGVRTARRVAEDVREAVEQHEFDALGTVTLSAGAAERREGEPTQDWFARLDAALYRAKAGGRNRVEVDAQHEDAEALSPALHLAWLDRYECGETTIDTQHRTLFGLANEVLDHALRESTATVPMLETLFDHVRKHFEDEERILGDHAYEGLAYHRRAHDRLLQQASRLLVEAKGGKAHFGALTQFLVADVVSRHMLHEDRGFAMLFRQPRP